MKKGLFLLVFVLLANGFSGCEKDDICDANSVTTPRLIISFYDFNNRSVAKNVSNLRVTAVGSENGIIFNSTATNDSKYLTSDNEIAIPLNISGDVVDYDFVLNAGANDATPLTDQLQFNYTRSTFFVSRACGYSVFFKLNDNNSLPDAFILNGIENVSEGNWIKDITVENYNLTSENETHLKIYF